ncbi:MAG: diaminopimelate epimerase [Verrucomicrobia bacterium]|nr:diaminopimelate epimerase [Verrucomicrobiota bacterium]
MQFSFAKYQGAGNDFILIDDEKMRFPLEDASYISRLCHRRFGIGADGVVLLQSSEKADFRMRIFNADGKEAAQCGNGLRCLVDFIHQKGHRAQHFLIETQKRIIPCSWDSGLITIDFGPAEWLLEDFSLDDFSLHLINTGVPHLVAFVDQLNMSDFKSMGAKLRHHAAFSPEGANVNFAQLQGDKIYVRTYERGVEDETLACGTGAAAVAIAALKKYSLKNPVCIVPASKEELLVEATEETIRLKGPATCVFYGYVPYSFP